MERCKKKRAASKDVVFGLLSKAADAVNNITKLNEVQSYLNTVDKKMCAIKELDDKIDEIKRTIRTRGKKRLKEHEEEITENKRRKTFQLDGNNPTIQTQSRDYSGSG